MNRVGMMCGGGEKKGEVVGKKKGDAGRCRALANVPRKRGEKKRGRRGEGTTSNPLLLLKEEQFYDGEGRKRIQKKKRESDALLL